MIASGLLFCWPILRPLSWVGGDAPYHLDRLISTLAALHQGQLPPFFDFTNDKYFGNSWNLFYPPLSLFVLLAGFFLWGHDINHAIELLALSTVLLAGWTAWAAGRDLFADRNKRLCAAAFYALSPYMASNFYQRYALAEALALAFLPLLLAGLGRFESGVRSRLIGWSLALMLLSDLPACSVAIAALGLYLLLSPERGRLLRQLLVWDLPVVLGGCAFFLGPFLFEATRMPVFMTSAAAPDFPRLMQANSLSFENLFLLTPNADHFQLGLGLPAAILLFWFVGSVVRQGKAFPPLLLVASIFTIAILGLIPFGQVPRAWGRLLPMQFPWRSIGFIAAFVSLGCMPSLQIRPRTLAMLLLVSALSGLQIGMVALGGRLNYNRDYDPMKLKIDFFDYTPMGVKDHPMSGGQIGSTSCHTIHTEIGPNGFPFYDIGCDRPDEILLPAMAYAGIVVRGGSVVRVENGRFRVRLPAGASVIRLGYGRGFLLLIAASWTVTILFLSFAAFRAGRHWRTARRLAAVGHTGRFSELEREPAPGVPR
ncbi:hypothetical protein [Rhizosaccharibacter radicis]|uniref:Membrane protein 6-pyruvoyl-tetrahydropterin synthase-related domain-containing protein n=1 Tax=Rhizosaccharibacter radicis TaxID=2782605 RepID=A0ABT1VWZ3_9PROT|nr:hypothetical protein [Acetobacteraceae bacterium KSS12]